MIHHRTGTPRERFDVSRPTHANARTATQRLSTRYVGNLRGRAPHGGAVSPSLHVSDLFPERELRAALDDRLVVRRPHPSRDLWIYNYTERCQYERGLWNRVTLQCRGLIVDGLGSVMARPFKKFFNYGQAEGPQLDPTSPVCVTDKLDGSLGILYCEDAIATRGSFTSDQAEHATALLRSRYAHFRAPDGWTLLFEIVYPQNRIVLDYGERDDLILLGAVEIATGKTTGPHEAVVASWPGPRANMLAYATLSDALAAPARQNAEGLVIHCLTTDERLKIKQADYVALHKIVSGLNERAVWQHLADDKPIEELLAALPDEFHAWTAEVAERLSRGIATLENETEHAYRAILHAMPPNYTRKDFALIAKDRPNKAALFQLLDGKDCRAGLWDQLRPAPLLGPRGLSPSEDSA